MSRFQNKVAIVTGAGSGIGLATALHLAKEGAQTVLVDIKEDRLKKASEEIEDFGLKPLLSVCDVSRSQNVEQSAKIVMDKFGSIDIIINNAGLMVFKPLEQQSVDDWMKVLGVDLLGTLFFMQQGFLHMKNGGSIVNVSSIHAVETTPLVSSYAAAKSAVLSLTRSGSIEGKEKKIRVNAILPGAVDTPMLWENPNVKSGLEVINQSDIGKPEDIASAIAFLASDDSSFVTGATLRVDGGRLAKI
ncbi:SDR family NAD(P)-dependent oxidoreductase [Bdellovibrio sp. BCCA]|uniref:SDR family NAD(P)-dependent oxidoreductase n=1 Tax=Bdellovibrio sp. BCCA TaxID=3136281 RepID=UPI0030F0A3BF